MSTLKKLLPWNWNVNWRSWLPWNWGKSAEIEVQKMDAPGSRGARDLVPRLLREPLLPSLFGFAASPLLTWPRVDLEEGPDAYTLRAEVPEARPEDVEVILRGRDLVLRGESDESREEERDGVRYQVRRYDGWHRRVRIPEDVDVDGVRARVDAGELTVTLPRVPGQRREIPVRAA